MSYLKFRQCNNRGISFYLFSIKMIHEIVFLNFWMLTLNNVSTLTLNTWTQIGSNEKTRPFKRCLYNYWQAIQIYHLRVDYFFLLFNYIHQLSYLVLMNDTDKAESEQRLLTQSNKQQQMTESTWWRKWTEQNKK